MKRVKNWLQSFSERLTQRTKKMIMTGLCLLVAGYAIGLIFGVISYEFTIPQSIVSPYTPHNERKPETGNLKQQIEVFRWHMDSLSTTAEGRLKRDSILLKHPGIMDTIARLEQLINH